jgi:hypothetical protein
MKRASLMLFGAPPPVTRSISVGAQGAALSLLLLSGCFDFKTDLVRCVDAGACTPPPPTLVTGDLCSGEGWCWATRLPHNFLTAVVSLSANDVWAFGNSDTVLRYDGTQWVFVGGLAGNHADAMAFGPNDLFVVGDGFHHWNGTAWQTVASLGFPISRIHGVSADDLWLVPADGSRPLYHWFGHQLSPVPLPAGAQVSGVFAVSTNSVWATGQRGFVAHWDGSSWSPEDAGTVADLTPVWANSDDDLWVGGDRVVARRSAAGWQVEGNSNLAAYSGIAGVSATEVWFSGWDGQLATWGATGPSFSKLDTSSLLRGMTKTANGGVMVVGSGGYIAERRGTWARLDGDDPVTHFYDVHGSSETDVWAVGGKGVIAHFEGTKWTFDVSGGGEFEGVFAPSANTTWAVDDTGALRRRTASGWQIAHSISGKLEGVWAADDETLWAVGTSAGAGIALHVVHGVATPMTVRGVGLNAVWGNNDSDVWAAGAGVLVHWDGSSWSEVTSPTMDGVGALRVKDNQLWLSAGNNVHHFDGAIWHLPARGNDRMTGLALDGARVWFSSENGVIGIIEGEMSGKQATNVQMSLGGVWASPSGYVFTAGNDGALLQRAPMP